MMSVLAKKRSVSNLSAQALLGTTQRHVHFLRLTLVFFSLLNVAAHLYASPGATPIVSYWIDIETATYGLIATVYLLGLRRYYVVPILFTTYNMALYFLSGIIALPFGINSAPLVGHVQFALYSFGRGMSLAAWIYLLVAGIVMLKVDAGSALNQLLDEPHESSSSD